MNIATNRIEDWMLLVGRVFMSGLFLWDGSVLLRAPGLAADYMAAHGVPALLLPAVILLQLGGGLLVLAGWWTHVVALAFAGFALLTALIFHADAADTGQLIHFGKDIAISGGFLFLAAAGPGAFSIDQMRRARRGAGQRRKPSADGQQRAGEKPPTTG